MDADTEKRDAVQKREDGKRDAELNAAEQRRTIAALTQTISDQDANRDVVVADHRRAIEELQDQLQAAEVGPVCGLPLSPHGHLHVRRSWTCRRIVSTSFSSMVSMGYFLLIRI